MAKKKPYKFTDYTQKFREHYRQVAEPLSDWHKVAYDEVRNFLKFCQTEHGFNLHLRPFDAVEGDEIHLELTVDQVPGMRMPITLFLHSVDEYCQKHKIISAYVGGDKAESTSIRLLDHSHNYETLLDEIIRQGARYKAAQDLAISRSMDITRK